jgi:cytochrome c peroxidase
VLVLVYAATNCPPQLAKPPGSGAPCRARVVSLGWQFAGFRAAPTQARHRPPIANPGEMASSHELSVHILQSIPGYVSEFKRVFGTDKIDIDKVTEAISAFEETLATPNSRFDQWLNGDKKALNQQEVAGYQLFKDAGCVACHNGPSLGGNSFQKMGIVEP